MSGPEPSRIGNGGVLVIPAELLRRFGLEEGSRVVAEETPDGILIRPAAAVPTELYGDARKAELLLSNAVDADDYARAVARWVSIPETCRTRDRSQIETGQLQAPK